MTAFSLPIEIIWFCSDNSQSLWNIRDFVRWKCEKNGIETPDMKQFLLSTLCDLLEQDLIKIGTTHDVNESKWNLSPDAAIQRINDEWTALGDNLQFNDICWIEATDKGVDYIGKISPELR